MRTADLLELKRRDPRAYAAALAAIEERQLGSSDPAPAPAPRPDPGTPSQAAGVKTARTDARGIVTRPDWSKAESYALLDTALDYAPDPHYAAHTAKALGLQGWTVKVTEPDTDDPHDEGQAAIDAFAERVGRPYGGGLGALLSVAMDSVLRRGAVALELDISDSRDDVLDVGFVDPLRIDFQLIAENGHGRLEPVYLPGPGRPPIRLPSETFHYAAANAGVGRPHGRSPYLPLIDTTAPTSRLRVNLQRLLDNQAFARQAFVLSVERVLAQAPPDVARRRTDGQMEVVSWDRYRQYLQAQREDVEATVKGMYADDTWVLYDSITPQSVGASHGSESLKPGELAQVFDQDAITSCLGLPAVHGRNWGAALSTTGNVQWMVYTLGLEGLRDVPRRAVQWALSQYLRIRGIRARCELVFEPITAGDPVQEAQADEIKTRTIAAWLEMGLITAEEAALTLTGHGLPGPEPRPAVTGSRYVTPLRNDYGTYTNGHNGHGNGLVGTLETAVLDHEQCQERAHATRGGAGNSDRHGVGGGLQNGVTTPLPEVARPCGCGSQAPDARYVTASRNAPTRARETVDTNINNKGTSTRGVLLPGEDRWEPEDEDWLDWDALGSDPLDEDDIEERRAAFDRWAKRRAGVFVGIMAATWWVTGDDVPPGWVYEHQRDRYHFPRPRPDQLGRMLQDSRLVELMGRRVGAAGLAGSTGTLALLQGSSTVPAWQTYMAQYIRAAHVDAYLLGAGGVNGVTAQGLQQISAQIERQYRYLARFGRDVANGQLSERQILARAEQYFGASPRQTHRLAREERARAAGKDQERNVIESGAPCAGCEEETDRGWVAIGTIKELGARDCHGNCLCWIEHRERPPAEAGDPDDQEDDSA